MKYILCLLFLFGCLYSSLAYPGRYHIQNFTPKTYKAGIQNIDFAQNRDMTLFVANNLGVLSFNGKEWETHAFKPGKKKRSLAFDEYTNRLYVGSQGEFGYFEQDWNYISLVEKIPIANQDFDEVWDVYLFNSKIYFCTFQGIYVYDGETISCITHDDGFERSFHANGKLLTQSQQGKLFSIEDNKLTRVYQQNLSGEIIAGVIPHEAGYLLFYNSGKIEYTTSFGSTTQYPDLIRALKGSYVNHVLQLADSRLVISTQTSGLFLYDLQKQSIEHITTEAGLESNACLRAFQDYAGNLWVGMQNGIALIHINSPMRLIDRSLNIQGSGYEAFETDAGTYYTTSNGIYFLAKNDTKCVFLHGTEGPAYGLQEIAGSLYAGHQTGLFLLDKTKAKHVANMDGLWRIKPLRSNPEFAVGGTYSGLYLFKINKNEPLQAVQKISGFNESSRFFEEDLEGNIWVGQYYKGLFRLTLSDDLTEAIVVKVSDDYDIPIHEQIIIGSIDNNLYITSMAGLYQLDQTKGRIMDADNFFKEFSNQPVYLMEQDHHKNVHVIGKNQVGFYKQISLKNYVFVPSSLFQLRYYLNNDLLNISVHSHNGVLFSANEGFIQYNPDLEKRGRAEQPLVIRRVYSVTQDSNLYALKPFDLRPQHIDPFVVHQSARVLQIDVESYQFSNVNNLQFRYFLKGFDDNYGEWTNATSKEYSNLKEGNYTFLAQAQNYLGEIANSQPLSLRVKPPFYRSLLAKILYTALVFLILLLIYRYQNRRYQMEAKKIEEGNQLELAEKQKKLIEIEQQKERELSQLEEKKIESELRHVNNLLAASTMNLVVKNEFIETIKEELKAVKKKGNAIETKMALEQIVKEIDTSLRLQEDWNQFEYHFDQVHGDLLKRLRDEFTDLSPNEQKLCVFLRLNLNTKEIANLMSISIRGVELARYRLRKKLRLDKGQNLSKFILEY
jgi:ligand-binding sensor domain-containing protein